MGTLSFPTIVPILCACIQGRCMCHTNYWLHHFGVGSSRWSSRYHGAIVFFAFYCTSSFMVIYCNAPGNKTMCARARREIVQCIKKRILCLFFLMDPSPVPRWWCIQAKGKGSRHTDWQGHHCCHCSLCHCRFCHRCRHCCDHCQHCCCFCLHCHCCHHVVVVVVAAAAAAAATATATSAAAVAVPVVIVAIIVIKFVVVFIVVVVVIAAWL